MVSDTKENTKDENYLKEIKYHENILQDTYIIVPVKYRTLKFKIKNKFLPSLYTDLSTMISSKFQTQDTIINIFLPSGFVIYKSV